MNQICCAKNCTREIFKDESKCALHCHKHDYQTDLNSGLLQAFYTALENYITHQQTEQDIEVTFTQIFFPQYDLQNTSEYISLLAHLPKITFNFCRFNCSELPFTNTEYFFQACEFRKDWHISDAKISKNSNDVLYHSCHFKQNTYLNTQNEELLTLDFSLFTDCAFDQLLFLKNTQFNQEMFKNTKSVPIRISQLMIEDCNFTSRFSLNNAEIKSLSILHSEFKSKFELKESNLEQANIINANFSALFDTYRSQFKKFLCSRCIFDGFVGFEECQFSKGIQDSEPTSIPRFEYATFLSFVNFRNSTFHNGLNLDLINLSGEVNFLNSNIAFKNTSRETYRIIKYSFDKVGDHIEANHFFADEMKKYKEYLFSNPNADKQEKCIFWLNEKMSNFGQNYIQPLILMVIFAILYGTILYGYQDNWIANSFPTLSHIIEKIMTPLNFIAKNIMPFKRFADLKPGMEFISLVFTIILASLTWQLIVAIKRNTRR